jgi:hypothetical protein
MSIIRENAFIVMRPTREPSAHLSLANCYFTHNSSGFPVLLRFCEEQPARSFHSPKLQPRPKMGRFLVE